MEEERKYQFNSDHQSTTYMAHGNKDRKKKEAKSDRRQSKFLFIAFDCGRQ